jgi:hypothetical protein
MTIGFAAVPFAFIVVEVPLAVGTMALERATAPPPGLVTLTPGLSVTVNEGGPVVGPPKVMLVLKVPVHMVLGWAAVSVPGVFTGLQLCARAGSDTPSDNGTRHEAARSSNFRRLAPTLDRMARPPVRQPNDSTYTRVRETRLSAKARTRRFSKTCCANVTPRPEDRGQPRGRGSFSKRC